MSKTRAELVNEALGNLGVLAAGQTASAEDYTEVDSKVGPLIRRLAVDDIVLIADPNAIEDEFFEPLGVLLADAAKAKFGGGAFDAAVAEGRLRSMSRSGPTYEISVATYY